MSAELMARAQAGDLDAFGQIYAEHRDFLLGIARKRLYDEAEDIVQDVFVRALGNLHRWADQGKNPRGWLTVITVNMRNDRAKSAHRRKSRPFSFDYDLADLDRPDPAHQRPEELCVRREELAAVADQLVVALEALCPEQRKAIVLRYLDELTQQATADELGRHVDSVKSLLYRARQTMRQVLADA